MRRHRSSSAQGTLKCLILTVLWMGGVDLEDRRLSDWSVHTQCNVSFCVFESMCDCLCACFRTHDACVFQRGSVCADMQSSADVTSASFGFFAILRRSVSLPSPAGKPGVDRTLLHACKHSYVIVRQQMINGQR